MSSVCLRKGSDLCRNAGGAPRGRALLFVPSSDKGAKLPSSDPAHWCALKLHAKVCHATRTQPAACAARRTLYLGLLPTRSRPHPLEFFPHHPHNWNSSCKAFQTIAVSSKPSHHHTYTEQLRYHIPQCRPTSLAAASAVPCSSSAPAAATATTPSAATASKSKSRCAPSRTRGAICFAVDDNQHAGRQNCHLRGQPAHPNSAFSSAVQSAVFYWTKHAQAAPPLPLSFPQQGWSRLVGNSWGTADPGSCGLRPGNIHLARDLHLFGSTSFHARSLGWFHLGKLIP